MECCHLLLQCCKGPKLVNQLDNSNKNALHYAAAAGHYLLLRELVGVEGVDLEAEDPDDRWVREEEGEKERERGEGERERENEWVRIVQIPAQN